MRQARWYSSSALLLLAVSGWTSACADQGRYVWARDVRQTPQQAEGVYTIRAGDLLDVRVYNEDRLSTRPRVRADGMITVPLLGEVVARGKTPPQLAQELGSLFSKYLNSPTVTVAVEESRPLTVTVMGEFAHPGVFTLAPDAGLAQALAAAGGFTDYADRDALYVVRSNPPQRVRFRYRDLVHNDPATINFKLLDGDMVTVE
jgi:polysaccharide export outer membrane protein